MPLDAPLTYRALYVNIVVIRKPINEYVNYNYNPPKSRYATLTFSSEDVVYDERCMEYPKQSWYFSSEQGGQNLVALQCAYQGILESFANLGTALGLNVVSLENHIELWKPLSFLWRQIKVVCYADTAVDLYVHGLQFDKCPHQSIVIPVLPPLVPDVIPVYPPSTSLSGLEGVSPPYEGEDDSGNSNPNQLDQPITEPPPGQDSCQAYLVTFRIQFLGASSPENFSYGVWGIIGDWRLNPETTNPSATVDLQLFCQGTTNNTCLGTQTWVNLRRAFKRDFVSIELLSIEEI